MTGKLGHAGRLALLLAAGLMLAACQSEIPKELTPVPNALKSKMQNLAMNETAPIYMRIFKEESKLEVWKQRRDGKYGLLASYDICKWSGELGPKKAEGDRQAPEGFYAIAPGQMNPKSSYYLSFNLGYPNSFDQSYGRTGKHLMVHGACSSAGCYSMTDEQMAEIFALARDAFRGGQKAFQVHAFPFRMTPENMARHRDSKNMAFWKNLKRGYDHFEVTQVVPSVDVCDKRYVFDATARNGRFNATSACPAYDVPDAIATAVSAKEEGDDEAFQVAVAKLQQEEAPAALSDTATVATAYTAPEPTPRPQPEAERPSLFSRIFGRGQPEPEAPAPAAAPATTKPAVAAAAPAAPLPQAKPAAPAAKAVAAAAPKPTPAPAPAKVATRPVPAPAPSTPAPQPEMRSTVAATPAPAAAAPATNVATAAEPAKTESGSNFNSRFLVPLPGAAPTVSSGLSSSSATSAR